MKNLHEESRFLWIRILIRMHRPCPNCGNKTLPTSELMDYTSRCAVCLKDYELDMYWYNTTVFFFSFFVIFDVITHALPIVFVIFSSCALLLLCIRDGLIASSWLPVKDVSFMD